MRKIATQVPRLKGGTEVELCEMKRNLPGAGRQDLPSLDPLRDLNRVRDAGDLTVKLRETCRGLDGLSIESRTGYASSSNCLDVWPE
jgi:hypothetical protein